MIAVGILPRGIYVLVNVEDEGDPQELLLQAGVRDSLWRRRTSEDVDPQLLITIGGLEFVPAEHHPQPHEGLPQSAGAFEAAVHS